MGIPDEETYRQRISRVVRSLEHLPVLQEMYGSLRDGPPRSLEEATAQLEECVELLAAQMEFQRRSEEAERATGPEPDRPWRSTTGLWREDYVRDILPLEFERAKRYKYPLTCVMLTPDCYEDLAAVEDELAARQLLLDLAQEVRSRLRRCDLCCQIDERTVLALLPNTSLEGTVTAATRLREVGPSLAQARSEERPITVSIGCYTLAAGNALDADDLLARAREALEEAQQRGGNNACMRGGYRWDLAGDGGGQSRSRPGTSC